MPYFASPFPLGTFLILLFYVYAFLCHFIIIIIIIINNNNARASHLYSRYLSKAL